MKTKENTIRIILIFILSSIFIIYSVSRAEATNSILSIEYKNGQLAIRAENVPLDSLLRGIGGKTGVVIEARQGAPNSLISFNCSFLPLVEAFERIFSHLRCSYFMRFEENRLQKVLVLHTGGLEKKTAVPKLGGSGVGGETSTSNSVKMDNLPAAEHIVVEPVKEEIVVLPVTEHMVVEPVKEEMVVLSATEHMVVEPGRLR